MPENDLRPSDQEHLSGQTTPGFRQISLIALLPLLLSVVHAAVASQGAPLFDDALIELMVDEGGPALVEHGHRETPGYAKLMSFGLELGIFWELSTVALILAWTLAGLFASLTASRLGCSDPLSLVACAVLASTGLQAQYYMNLSTIWGTFLVPMLLWGVVLWSLRQTSAPSPGVIVPIITFGVVLSCTFFTNYALPTTIAALAVAVGTGTHGTFRRVVWPAALGCGLGLLLWFGLVGDGGERESVSLMTLLGALPERLIGVPSSLAEGVWKGTVGLIFDRFGSITFVDAKKATLFGGLTAAAGFLVARSLGTISRGQQDLKRSWLPALIAIPLATLPIALTGRSFDTGLHSRYFLTTLPLLAAVVVGALHLGLRGKIRVPALLLLLFGCGYTFEIALERHLDRGRVAHSLSHAVIELHQKHPESHGPSLFYVRGLEKKWPYRSLDWLELTAAFREEAVGTRGADSTYFRPWSGESAPPPPSMTRPLVYDRGLEVFQGIPDRVFEARLQESEWEIRQLH